MNSSDYVNNQRKEYSLYVLQSRAIPAASDGLKAGGRRVLWTARDGKKYKSATLAGGTMPIHPHAMPEGAIDTLAAPYGNNIPLLHGEGAFGTLLNPTAYGASRYTEVKISQFTKDVVFRDIEIIPMQENYDGTLMEPVHFLPLIPIVLLNPSEGIAIGFASKILPRDLINIIETQLECLSGNKNIEDVFPNFTPTNNIAVGWEEDKNGNTRWSFEGDFVRVNSTTIQVTKLPYGLLHEKFIEHLNKLEENEDISLYTDSSKDVIDVEINFKRGVLDKLERHSVLELLKLTNNTTENMNVLNFDGTRVWSTNYVELIQQFCVWRLGWYQTRYERLKTLLQVDIQRYEDVLTAIKKNVGGSARKISSRSELKEFLTEIGVVNIDYIADLPIYRFTEEEKNKTELKLEEANNTLKYYDTLLSSESERRKIYVKELKEILNNYQQELYDV